MCCCSQGIGVMELRHISEKIPLTEVPSIMRALGYYPTEQEVVSCVQVSVTSRVVFVDYSVNSV